MLGHDSMLRSHLTSISSKVPFRSLREPIVHSNCRGGDQGDNGSGKRLLQVERVEEGEQGVWNFAYGANINPWKLENVRGIIPLEMVRGFLSGWRLVFNHRGGMGNLE